MKIDILSLGLAGVLLATLSCGSGDSETTESDAKPETTPTASAAEIAAYPLTTCVVSGEELGSMGDPIDFMHDGKLIRLCCKGCIPDVKEDPDKFLAMLADADGK